MENTAGTATGFAVVRLMLNDGNDIPNVSLSGITDSLPENTSTAQSLKVANIVIADDVLGTNVPGLTGADASSFVIVSNAGVYELHIKAGTILNFEVQQSYSVTVAVDDAMVGGSPDDTVSYTLNLTDVNDPPTLSIFGPFALISEDVNTSAGYHVLYFGVNDEDPATSNNVLSLSGTDAGKLEIVGTELRIKPGVILDYETATTLSFTLSVDDPGIGLPGVVEFSSQLTISILDVNDTRPTISANQFVNIAEGAALNSTHELIQYVDPDTVFTTFTWRIDGAITDTAGNTSAGSFTFANAFGLVNAADGRNGAVKVLNPALLDFDNPLLPKVYVLHNVVVRDNGSGLDSVPVDVQIRLTGVNDELPIITVNQTILVPEKTATGQLLSTSDQFGPIAAVDKDLSDGTYTWTIVSAIGNDTSSTSYPGLFAVDSSFATDGNPQAFVRVLSPALLDFDRFPSFSNQFQLTLSLNDGNPLHAASTQTVLVKLTDVNDEVPVIVQPSANFSIPESAANGTLVGDLDVTDLDTNNTFGNWMIVGGNVDGVFGINAATGVIVVSNRTKLDFETRSTYSLQVRVSDGVNLSAVSSITIDVTNIVEPPEISIRLVSPNLEIAHLTGSVDFGITKTNTALIRTFEVTNHGDSDLVLGTLTVPSGYSIITAPAVTVPRFGITQFQIQLDALSTGQFAGTISLATNEPTTVGANVDGIVEAPFTFNVTAEVTGEPSNVQLAVDPGAIFQNDGYFDFGSTIDGTPVPYRFRVTNIGTGSLSITGIAAPAGFLVLPTAANPSLPSVGTPWVLAENEARQFEVSLVGTPVSFTGNYFGDLLITSDDASAPDFSVRINGEVNSSSFVQIIDDGGSGFSTNNTWFQTSDSGYTSDYLYNGDSTGINNSLTATWNFGTLVPGVYTVATTWASTNWPNLASVRPFNNTYGDAIYDVTLGGVTTSHTVDQFGRPRGFEANGTTWQQLTTVVVEAGSLSVTLRSPANAATRIIADAVRIERLAPTTDVIGLPAGRSEHHIDVVLNDSAEFQTWRTDGATNLSRAWTVQFVDATDANGVPTSFATSIPIPSGGTATGTIVAENDGTVTLRLDAASRSTLDEIRLQYRLVNASGLATAVTPVTLYFSDDAPLSAGDAFSTSHGRPLTFDAIWNDRDPQGDAIHSELPSPKDGVLLSNGLNHDILDRNQFWVEIPSNAAPWNLQFDWLSDGAGTNVFNISNLSDTPENDLPAKLVAAGVIDNVTQVVIVQSNNAPRTKRIRFTDGILQSRGLAGFTVSVSGNPDISVAHRRGGLLQNIDNTWTFTPDASYFRLVGSWTEELFYVAADDNNLAKQVQKTTIKVTNSAPWRRPLSVWWLTTFRPKRAGRT
ncbi:MAG: cadherin domain-containing protein [Planctomycetaceae bacterium]